MAISDAYATVGEYRANIGKHGMEADDEIEPLLLSVSRYLDEKLSQPSGFNKDATATTRIYECIGNRVEVDPIASLAGLEVRTATSHDTEWAEQALETGYQLLPFNADKGPEPRPWTTIHFSSPRHRVVHVTAIHGWPAVPEGIKHAVIQLAAMLRVDSPFATDRISEMPDTAFTNVISASPQARAILRGLSEVYNRYPIGVG